MTTRIGREVRRLVPPRGNREIPLIVTLTPEGIYFREFGRRTKWLLPYGVGKLVAVRLSVEAEKKAKLDARRARRDAKLNG